ncbi:MAG: hypothetical protein JNM66_14885 [Bryobacterales bacterium]|nr:hypothetical protein [Bryobacterales bacterium]
MKRWQFKIGAAALRMTAGGVGNLRPRCLYFVMAPVMGDMGELEWIDALKARG